jgi:DNA-binding NtrC family response regulator
MSERKGAFVPVNCAAIPADLIESELFGHTGSAFTGAKQARSGLFEAADGGTIFLDEICELPMAMQPNILRALQDGAVRRVGENHERGIDVRVIAATNRNLEQDVIERAVAFAHGVTVTPEDLPKRVRAGGGVSAIIARSSEQNLSLRDLEREYIFEMLRRTGGNKKRAAEMLGLDRKTLYRKLESTTRTAIGWNCSFLPHYEAYDHIPKTPTWQLLLPVAALRRIARYCLKSFSLASW